MIRVILHGANGYMGRTVEQFAAEREDLTIVAGVDTAGTPSGAFPVENTRYTTLMGRTFQSPPS